MNKAALAEYFNWASGHRSALGGLDCVRFVIEALQVGWGADYREQLLYSDRRSAVNRLRSAGGLESACDEAFPVSLSGDELQPGDVAYFPDPTIGLVMPGYVAVKYRRTILRVPLGLATKGWRAWAQQ